MNLKENYFNEMSLLKNERIERVIEAAKVEFSLNGIKNSKLRVIARRAQVGEASIYRYFKDKDDLIQFVGLSYWQNHANSYEDFYYARVHEDDNGLKKIEISLNIFHHLYDNHKDFLKFVDDYDNYYANDDLNPSESSFKEIILTLRTGFINDFNQGIEDGSINPKFNAEEKYTFVSPVMVSTTQKLSAQVGKQNGYDVESAKKCISELIDMFIQYIKN
jgi:AcrR family transcriptional regulator